jgi:uncharacterized membrane protein YvbJ
MVECPECGEENDPKAKKCLTCGFKFGMEVEKDLDLPEDEDEDEDF